MERDALSMRQMMVLLAVSLLAPITELLPNLAAGTLGSAGWLAPVGAFPLLLLALWAAGRLWRRGGSKACLLDSWPGKLLHMLYMLWALWTLGLSLGLALSRLKMVYDSPAALLWTAMVLVLAVWMALGKPAALARAGEIFYLALAVAVAVALVLAAGSARWSNLAVEGGQLLSLPLASLLTAGVLLQVFPAFLLGGQVARKPENRRRGVGWTAALCAVALLLLAAILGCLGPGLTLKLPAPFLTMVQGLRLQGAFQRTEALFAALWLLSDLVLSGLMLHAWRRGWEGLCPRRSCRWSLPPAAAAAALLGWLLAEQVENPDRWLVLLALPGLLLGLALPLIFQLFAQKKGKR